MQRVSASHGSAVEVGGHQALITLKAEMTKTREGGQSDLMDLLIVYKWKDLFGEFTVDPVTITHE